MLSSKMRRSTPKRVLYGIVFLSVVLLIVLSYRIFTANRTADFEYVFEENTFSKADIKSQLLNLTDFKYLVEPTKTICSDDVFAVLLVTSYAGHDQVRAAHRAALPRAELQRFNVVRVFLLADIPGEEKFITQKSVDDERNLFNDIVQGNFLEAYRNLAYKHAMGLRWAAYHPCLKPKFIVKMDDDIVVDFRHLFAYLRAKDKFTLQLSHDPNQHYLSGYLFKNVVPIRLELSKWYVTEEEFRSRVYPDYLSGWMYAMTPHTARALTTAAFQAKSNIFWIDDIWITGIVRETAKVPIAEEMNHLFSANSQFLDCCIADLERSNLRCPFMAGPNGGDHRLIAKLAQTIRARCFTSQEDPYLNFCEERVGHLLSIKKTCVGVDKHLLRSDRGAAFVKPVEL